MRRPSMQFGMLGKCPVVTNFALLILGFGCAGCGGGSDNLATAKVTGKVTYNNMPVTGGSVTFSPISSASGGTKPSMVGKPAAGVVGSDGTFSLSTYGSGDGAVVGKHRVSFSPPAVEIDEAQHKEDSKPPVSPYAGLVPKTTEVEVKAGSNTIDIELIPNPNAASGS
jgi:hypothetical protein